MILINGCSYTFGDELESPFEQRWSKYLEDTLNVEVVNIANCGASNPQIFRTTMDHIFEYKDKLQGVIINWSAFERVEEISLCPYHNYDKDGKLINDMFVQMSPSRVSRNNRSIIEKVEAWRTYYGEIYCQETGIVNTTNYMRWIWEICQLYSIDCFQTVFHEGNRARLYRTFSDNRMRTIGPRLGRIYQKVFGNLSKLPLTSKFALVESNRMDTGLTFNEITDKYNCERMPKEHPGPDAHKRYADYLLGVFEEHGLFKKR